MLPKVGTTVGEKYALEAVIGRGGMGAVYRAKNLLTGRRVALKWILPTLNGADEMRARLFREARAMGRIEHANVCAVYDVGQDGDAIYLVMELLSGRSLRALMEERRLAVPEIAEILLEGMQGVSAAHNAGVVHRDLKPDNLFVCFDDDGTRGTTKVLDFGVSKILDMADSDSLTKSGMAVGTPHYMAPEQIIGSKDVDARSDVYGLGAILYQALAGRLPFEADNYSALVVQIATCLPEPLENHTDEEGAKLAPLVHKAIERKPSERFQSVQEMAIALEPFAGGVRFETPKPRPRSLPPPPSDETKIAEGVEGVSLTASASLDRGVAVDRDLAPTRAAGDARPKGSTPRLETQPTMPAHASGSQENVSSDSAASRPVASASPSGSIAVPTPSMSGIAHSSPARGGGMWIAVAVGITLAIVLAIGARSFSADDAAGTSAQARPPVSPPSTTPPVPPAITASASPPPSRHGEVASALAPHPAPLVLGAEQVATQVVQTMTQAAEGTMAQPGAAIARTDETDTPRDRLPPQGGQTRRGVRVSTLGPAATTQTAAASAQASMQASASGDTSMTEPTATMDGDEPAMTATGRSGTISTSDFE